MCPTWPHRKHVGPESAGACGAGSGGSEDRLSIARARARPPAKGDSLDAGEGIGGGDPLRVEGLIGGVDVGAITGDTVGETDGRITVGGPAGVLSSGGLNAPSNSASGATRGSAAMDPLGRMSSGGGHSAFASSTALPS